MRIALAQMKMSSVIRSNYEKSLQFIRQAAENKAELICFPEIQLCPFFLKILTAMWSNMFLRKIVNM